MGVEADGEGHRVVAAEEDLVVDLVLPGEVGQRPGAQGDQDGGGVGVEVGVALQHLQQPEVVPVEEVRIARQIAPGKQPMFDAPQAHVRGDDGDAARQRQVQHVVSLVAGAGVDGELGTQVDHQRQPQVTQLLVVGNELLLVQVQPPVVLQELGAPAAQLRVLLQQFQGVGPLRVHREKGDEAIRVAGGHRQHVLGESAHGGVAMGLPTAGVEARVHGEEAGPFHLPGSAQRIGHGLHVGAVGIGPQPGRFDAQAPGEEAHRQAVEEPLEFHRRVEQVGMDVEGFHGVAWRGPGISHFPLSFSSWPADAPGRRPGPGAGSRGGCRSGWCRCRRGRAAPARRAGCPRIPAGGWRRSGA